MTSPLIAPVWRGFLPERRWQWCWPIRTRTYLRRLPYIQDFAGRSPRYSHCFCSHGRPFSSGSPAARPVPGFVLHSGADRTVQSGNSDRVVQRLEQCFEAHGVALTRKTATGQNAYDGFVPRNRRPSHDQTVAGERRLACVVRRRTRRFAYRSGKARCISSFRELSSHAFAQRPKRREAIMNSRGGLPDSQALHCAPTADRLHTARQWTGQVWQKALHASC